MNDECRMGADGAVCCRAMLRRTGYTLGLLFVLACLAAYPLTWGRWAGVRYTGAEGWAEVGIVGGTFAVTAGADGRHEALRGFDSLCERVDGATPDWRAGVHRVTVPEQVTTIFFPVWMPALAASLFMAWRWRRRRTRSGGRERAGFPVIDKNA